MERDHFFFVEILVKPFRFREKAVRRRFRSLFWSLAIIEGLHGDVTDRVINVPAIFGGKIR